jgi:hypothetical protein
MKRMCESREELYKDICKDLSGTYYEIGTCWGSFSKFIIQNTPCDTLFCVDPYKLFTNLEYPDALNITTQEYLDSKFNKVKRDLSKVSDKIQMKRLTSMEAVEFVKDESASFVYIDANHEYSYVKNDILAWMRKVKPGGILAGDDVESMDLPHNELGNALIRYSEGPFALYGVHKALIDIKKEFDWFDYKIYGGQFVWKKPFHFLLDC